MKKRRIVIASLLKPVDDTRMFEKMGTTLSDSGDYEVFIIGYPSKSIPVYPNIHFLPMPKFSRISFGRPWAHLNILANTIKVKPDILIVNTHEILIVAILNRIFFGTRIIYDVRENHFRNILYSEVFPSLLRPFLAGLVRFTEIVCAPFFHHFFSAEEGYLKEISFFKKRVTVIENKAQIPEGMKRTSEPGGKRLLFSGTLAESTGVFQAIELAKNLHQLSPVVSLDIIGYCAKAHTLERIRAEIKESPFIHLQGGDQLVPHTEIITAIQAANFGIICYPPSRHTENSIPTKLYEYLACRLPIIVQDHAPWVKLISPFQAGIAVHFKNEESPQLLQLMVSPFYTFPPQNVTWESEGLRFLAALK